MADLGGMTSGGRLGRLVREPLVYFLALGAGLFPLAGARGRLDGGGTTEVVITAAEVEGLREVFRRTWQREPTAEEFERLLDERVRDEVLSREAVALGLDRDDTVVRRRLRQKLELAAESLRRAVEPAPGELEAFFAEHAERYRSEPRVSFAQVYLSADRRGSGLAADAAELLRRLRSSPPAENPGELGDPIMLSTRYDEATLSEVERDLGGRFAAQLASLPVGEWTGPVESGFGAHLVRLEEYREGRVPALAEAVQDVRRDWEVTRAAAAEAATYQRLLARYHVVVEWPSEAMPATSPAR